MLEDQLIAAARQGFPNRIRLLLALGVDPNGEGTGHAFYEGRTTLQEAAVWGYSEIVELLEQAGAQPSLSEVERFLAMCTQPDRWRTQQMLDRDPTLPERARSQRPDQLVRAAEKNSIDAVALLIELGFDVNAMGRTAPLHEAAMRRQPRDDQAAARSRGRPQPTGPLV
jgi:Ankyrin repeats (3 copies)/Ankyrin repeats (many copies)